MDLRKLLLIAQHLGQFVEQEAIDSGGGLPRRSPRKRGEGVNRSLPPARLRIRKQTAERVTQGWKIRFAYAPHQAVVHICVAVDQNIAERDDARQLGNRGGSFGIDAPQLVHRLADNLELAFDRGPQIFVRLLVLEVLAHSEARDALGGLLRVPQQSTRVSVHRRSGARR